MVSSRGSRGIPGAAPPPSPLPWASAGLFSHSALTAAGQQFLPFPKYVTTDALPVSLMGSALASNGSVGATCT